MDTTAQILEACIFLADKDAKVTINSVREYRGVGSNSTIGPVVALFNKNREMYQANAAPAGLKLAAASALDKVFIDLKETMTAEIDAVLSSKEEMSAAHDSQLRRRSDELDATLAEKNTFKDDLKKSQDNLKSSQDELTEKIQLTIKLKDVNHAIQEKLESLETLIERHNEEKKRNDHAINELTVALALSGEKKNHSDRESTQKDGIITALNLSFREAVEKNDAESKENREALAGLNKDLSIADKDLALVTSAFQTKLAVSEDKRAISEGKLQTLLAEITTLKDAKSACRESLRRQKIWAGKVLAKTLNLLTKEKIESAISLLGDSLDTHKTL